jgi:hypothetical protein
MQIFVLIKFISVISALSFIELNLNLAISCSTPDLVANIADCGVLPSREILREEFLITKSVVVEVTSEIIGFE